MPNQILHSLLIVLVFVDTNLHDVFHQATLFLRWRSLCARRTGPILLCRLPLASQFFVIGVEATSLADARELKTDCLTERGFCFLYTNNVVRNYPNETYLDGAWIVVAHNTVVHKIFD